MTLPFRTRVFVGSAIAAAVSLLFSALLLSWSARDRQRAVVEQRLTDGARLIADALSRSPSPEPSGLDEEADRFGRLVSSRVTLIAGDGRVVGDSTQSPAELDALDNHASRPEVVAARAGGLGVSRRFSTTVGTDMLYVAVRADHPRVAYVRLALPLTEVGAQLTAIRALTLVALASGVPVALLVSWLITRPLARRVQAIAGVAARYAAGDLSRPSHEFGTDELGAVARALDAAAQELGRRIEEISRDRALMEAILSGMLEGVLVIDGDGRVRLVNRAAQGLLQADASATGRPYLEVVRHPAITALLDAALRGRDAAGELELAREPPRTLLARAAPVAATPGGGGAVLVAHDITDLRRADRIRQDFVANVSHELRTPLTAVRGYVEALLDETPAADRTREYAEVIARHSARMERLVNDLLRLARLDARQEALDLAPCDVRQLFETIRDDFAAAIDAKRQRLTIEVPPEADLVQADAAKLHDIVRNLVENAVHYSPDGAEVRLASARGDGTFTITVADTGPGVPPQDLSRVFERFYRVDPSRTRPGGTGLGLAIVKHLAELHGGRVSAANRPAGGAVFTVTLPLRGG
jgi:two-component system phosphate regulon sensor histidine kinase PhoR